MNIWKIAILAAATMGSSAIAQDFDYHYVKVYYSDATRTVVVGQETLYCTNMTESHGTVTEYYRLYNGFCP